MKTMKKRNKLVDPIVGERSEICFKVCERLPGDGTFGGVVAETSGPGGLTGRTARDEPDELRECVI